MVFETAISLITAGAALGVFVWFFAYLPGRLWFHRHDRFDGLAQAVLSLVLGLVQFTLLQFFLGLVSMRLVAYFLVAGLALESLKKFGLRIELPWNGWKLSGWSWMVLIVGVIAQSSLMARSGLPMAQGGVQFVEYRDSLWHIALIQELAVRVPPLHPGFAGTVLTHYHFLTDLFFGSLLGLIEVNIFQLYFQVMPVFLSGLFGLVVVSMARRFLKGGETTLLVFTYFTGSLAWLVPFFWDAVVWRESTFWVSQTFSMLINPSLALSLSLVGVIALLLSELTEAWSRRIELALVILVGSLVGFKVYSAIVVGAGLVGYGLVMLMRGRYRIVRTGIGMALLALEVFLPTNSLNFSAGFLIWAPGWFLRGLVENPDRAYHTDWVLREQTLREMGSRLGILRLRAYELAFFLGGNLSVRVFGLLGIPRLRKAWSKELIFFWGFLAITGIVFPLLCIQRGSVANTVQTFYYTLIAANLFLVGGLLAVRSRFGDRIYRGLAAVLIVLALPTTIKLMHRHLTVEAQVVPAKRMRGYEILRSLPRDRTLVLVTPSTRNNDALWVSALGDKRVVYADKLMAENTRQPFEARIEAVENFFDQAAEGAVEPDSLRDVGSSGIKTRDPVGPTQVTHIVLVGAETDQYSFEALGVDTLYETDEMIIYEVEQHDGSNNS